MCRSTFGGTVQTTTVLSVIIPVLNGEAHLADQLSALAGQQYEGQWEVIVVDNGSADNTVAVAEAFREQLPALTVTRESRRGKANALNTGIGLARGDFLLLLDHDDEVEPGYLTAMESGLRRYDVVGGCLDHDTLNPPWARMSTGQTDGLPTTGYLPFTSGAAMGVRRQVALAVGGFHDMRAGEDIDFCWRAQRAGSTLGFVPDAVVRYRHREALRDVLRRGRSYGFAEVALYREHRQYGCPRRHPGDVTRTMMTLLVLAWRSRSDRYARYRLGYRVGQQVGRLSGAFRMRVVYL